MRKLVRLAALSVVAVMGGLAGAASATGYTFSVLSTGYGQETYALGLNNLGDVVGRAYQGLSYGAGVWHNGVYTSLQGLSNDPDDYGEARAINDAGQIAGLSTVSGVERATLWLQGKPIDLQAPLSSALNSGIRFSYASAINESGGIAGTVVTNRLSSFAFRASAGANGNVIDVIQGASGITPNAINNSGQMAGTGGTPTSGARHALVWTNGVAQELPNLGGRGSYAMGMNDRGEVVGASELQYGDLQRHAAYWSGSAVVDLGTLGPDGDFGSAMDINNRGEIVGMANAKAGGATHATMWVDGVAIDLNSLLDPALLADGWVLNEATAINDEGWIAGNARHGTLDQGYLLRPVGMPVPEASVSMMVLAGGLIVAGVSRRRHLRQL